MVQGLKIRHAFGLVALVALILSTLALLPTRAVAAPFGNEYLVDCPQGTYVTGLKIGSGAWIDRINVECSQFQSFDDSFGPPLTNAGAWGGSGGGPDTYYYCPPNMAVGAVYESFTRDPSAGHVDDLVMACFPWVPDESQLPTDRSYLVVNTEQGHQTDGDIIGALLDPQTPSRAMDFCRGPHGFAKGLHVWLYQASVSLVTLDCDHVEERTGTGSSPLTAAPPLPPLAYDGVDRPGSDISFADLASPDPNLCERSCDANGACRAWTYTKPGVKGPAARCYLKGAVPAAISDPCCVSGIRPPPGAAVGEDMPGADISFFDLATDDPNLCSAACLGNGACQAWTYTHPGVKGPAARCYLKNPRPAVVADPCCVSGVTDHLRAAAERKLIETPLCPAGWNQVVDPSLLPATYERQTVTLNGSSILCARRKIAASDIIKLIPPPCPPLMHHDANGQCVRNLLIVPNDTAPHQPTAPKAGPVCPRGWQKVDDATPLSRDWVRRTISMGGITITCAKFQIQVHPSQTPQTPDNPCDRQLLLPDGSCPPPPQLLPRTTSPAINLHDARKLMTCEDGQPRQKDGQCPPPPPKFHLKGIYRPPVEQLR